MQDEVNCCCVVIWSSRSHHHSEGNARGTVVNYENESIENERGKFSTAKHKIARSFLRHDRKKNLHENMEEENEDHYEFSLYSALR